MGVRLKAYIINLERCPERRKYMDNIMVQMPYLDYCYVNGVDGSNLTNDMIDHHFDVIGFKKRYVKNPSKSEIGVTLSHQNCYKKILDDNLPYAIVFEDDITIKRNIQKDLIKLKELYSSPEPCIILLSGWFWYKRKLRVDNIMIAKVNDGFLAQSYIINNTAARILYSARPSILADDWKFCANSGITVYGLLPRAFDQNWANFSSTNIPGKKIDNASFFSLVTIYLTEFRRKIQKCAGLFESCDYLENKVYAER